MPDTPRATRVHTIRRHLTQGGLLDLQLGAEDQRKGPDGHEVDGFAVRQTTADGVLAVVVGAYGPNWLRTLSEVCGRLESRQVKCTVVRDAPGLGDHEVLTRWASSEELQQRAAAEEARQSPMRALLRRQEAQRKAEEERQALEDAGQAGLF